jgi:hypothetical protein
VSLPLRSWGELVCFVEVRGWVLPQFLDSAWVTAKIVKRLGLLDGLRGRWAKDARRWVDAISPIH